MSGDGLPDDAGADEHAALARVRRAWPAGREDASPHLVPLIDGFLARFPDCVELWVRRSRAIQLSAEDSPWTLDEALESAERALAPGDAAVLSEVGFFHDMVRDDPERALPFFERAVRADPWSAEAFQGLAQSLARVGRESDVCLALLHFVGRAEPSTPVRDLARLGVEILRGRWSPA